MSKQWVTYNVDTKTYDTPDGTKIPAELYDSIECLLDVYNIAVMRDNQRKSIKVTKPLGPTPQVLIDQSPGIHPYRYDLF